MPKHDKITQKEIDYILRVAGKVPLAYMAEFLGCSIWTVCNHANKHGISTRVPKSIMTKYWPEFCPERWLN